MAVILAGAGTDMTTIFDAHHGRQELAVLYRQYLRGIIVTHDVMIPIIIHYDDHAPHNMASPAHHRDIYVAEL